MNHLCVLIYLDFSVVIPLFAHYKAHINCHCFVAISFENLWREFQRRFLVLTLWKKNICCQLNLFILNLCEEGIHIQLEIEFNLIYPVGICFFGILYLYNRDFIPLIFEFFFQKFTWQHIEHQDFFCGKFKFCIHLLKFQSLKKFFLLLFLLLIFKLLIFPFLQRLPFNLKLIG